MEVGTLVLFMGMAEYHTLLLEKRDEVPEVVSLDALLHLGYNPGTATYLLPRIRGNWGFLGLDLRYQALFERRIDSLANAHTFDAVMNFNLLVTRHVTLRIGTGLML